MKRAAPTAAILAACALSGCDNIEVVDKSDKVVLTKAEYEQLRAAALEAKQVGRYQLHREGLRTWRLDTATGKSCLLLTTESDWKGQDATESSCITEDYSERQRLHQLFPSLYDQNGNPIQQPPKQP